MKQRLFVILNLSLVSGLVILGFNIISPVLPQYALSFSIPVALTGWAVSAFALARMGMDIPAGFLADRFGNKRNMAFGLILITLSSIVAGSASSYFWLIIGRIIQGLGSALYVTAATTWVARISTGEYRGRFMALYAGLMQVATSFGPAIGGYSAARFGLHAPFFVYGAFSFLGLLMTLTLKETAESTADAHTKVRLSDVPGILKNGPFLLVNCSVFAVFFLRSGVRSTLIPLYSSLNLGLTEDRIGLLLTIAAVVTSLVVLPSGWLSDKIGRKKPMVSCLFLSAMAVVLVPFQQSWGGLVGAVAFYGFAAGLQGSMAAWPVDVAPREKLGTAIGIHRVIGDTGMFLGPITVTYVTGYTGDSLVTFTPFLIPALLALVAGILIFWAKDPAAKRVDGSVSFSVG